MARHARRGQATPITVAIMIAATLALALGIYAYFQGRATQVEEDRLLSLEIANTASMIDASTISWTSDDLASPTVLCYYVDVMNIGDQDKVFWLTVLPIARQASGYYMPTGNISLVPMDQDTAANGTNLYFYQFTDSNGDGEMEIVGQGGVLLYPVPPACGDIRGNATTLNNALAVRWVNPGSIMLSKDPPDLVELAQRVAGVAMAKDIPVLRLRLAPGEVTTLFIFIQVDDWDSPTDINPVPESLYLAVFTEFNGRMYMAIAFELPTS